MKTLLWIAAGYLGYEYFLAPRMAASAPASSTAAAVVPAPTVNPVTTRSLILAAAAKDNFTFGTVDEWDWYYGKARGIPAPDPITDWNIAGDKRGQKMTFEEYWTLASSHGMSGGYRYIG